MMEPATRRRLGDIFVERRFITEEQLATALDAQRASGGKLGEILVELEMITRLTLASVLSEQWDELRVTTSGRKLAEAEASRPQATAPALDDPSLCERVEVLTAQLAACNSRIAQLDATVAALVARQATA
jgi:hypothetical protein